MTLANVWVAVTKIIDCGIVWYILYTLSLSAIYTENSYVAVQDNPIDPNGEADKFG